MSDKTSIEWTATVNPDGSVTPGASWNPIRARRRDTGAVGWHCERVSPGCKSCYAAGINKRLGTGLDYVAPGKYNVEVFLDEKTLMQPLHWKRPRRIFVCSMTDWCGEFVTDQMRDRIMAVAALCPQHQFLFLTKRAKAQREYLLSDENQASAHMEQDALFEKLTGAATFGTSWPLPNCWFGVSCEDQPLADERFPSLCELGEAGWNTMCSLEPLLGPVVVPERYLALGNRAWCVIGGESGHGARPCDIAWIRSIIKQCRAAAVPCFVKQVGANVFTDCIFRDFPSVDWATPGHSFGLNSRKGGDPAEWPADIRVREWPNDAVTAESTT